MATDGEHEGDTLFGPGVSLASDDALLVSVYERTGRTLDDLPYTPEFEAICEAVGRADEPREVFRRLHNLRKAAKLPRLGRAPTVAVRLEPEEEELVLGLVRERVGTVGQRDRLPYTPEFDRLLERFNADTGRNLDRHTLWRLIAKLAK